jgi:hypothetical protein
LDASRQTLRSISCTAAIRSCTPFDEELAVEGVRQLFDLLVEVLAFLLLLGWRMSSCLAIHPA